MTARGLNKLLVAILVPVSILAFLSTGTAMWMWRNPGAVMAVRQAVDVYPPALRRAIRAEFDTYRDTVRADVADIDAARQRMFDLMRADPLDEEAIRAAMADVRQAVSDLQATGQEHLLDVMRDADPTERAKIRTPREGFSARLESFRD